VCICNLKHLACSAHAPYLYLWPIRPYCIFLFQLYLINGNILRKKKFIEHEMCFDFLYNFGLKLFFKDNSVRYEIIIIHWSLCKVPVILVRFQWKFNFLYRFPKNIQIQYFMIFRPVGAESLYADGRTDRQTWRS
jgi:hypothetical protein